MIVDEFIACEGYGEDYLHFKHELTAFISLSSLELALAGSC